MEVQALVPGPVVSCAFVDGGAASTVWSAQLDSIACPQGTCGGAFPDVAVASDGSVWAVATLVGPLPGGVSAAPLGRALARFDATGKAIFAKAIDVATRLADTNQTTAQGASVDHRGHLLLNSPAVGALSLELRDYDEKGNPGPSRPLADRASFGNVRIAGDGSLVLAYEYSTGDAGAMSPQHVGIARFDSAGRLLWNQTALSSLGVSGRSIIVGFDPAAGAMARLRVVDSQSPTGRQLVVRLDPGGNLTWARESGDVAAAAAAGAADGSVYALTAPSFAAGLVMDRIDAAGAGIWQVSVPGFDPTSSTPDIAAIDDQGGAWVVWTSAPESPATAIRVSADGRQCTRYALDVPFSVSQPDNSATTDNVRLVPVGPHEFAFATMTAVGRVRFP